MCAQPALTRALHTEKMDRARLFTIFICECNPDSRVVALPTTHPANPLDACAYFLIFKKKLSEKFHPSTCIIAPCLRVYLIKNYFIVVKIYIEYAAGKI